jgi:hypothetical protein
MSQTIKCENCQFLLLSLSKAACVVVDGQTRNIDFQKDGAIMVSPLFLTG